MTIWILALILFGGLAAAGFYQGGVRAAVSLVGLLLASLLAIPFAPLLKPTLAMVGVKSPLLGLLIPPFAVFLIVLILFKVAAQFAHQKVDVHYKYKAGDLKQSLWLRLNHRLGLCLGLANAAIYLALISMVIHLFSYSTVQMATSGRDSFALRLFNRLGKDLDKSRFIKTAGAISPAPDAYFDLADIVGLIYRNPIVHSRLARYPALLALGERNEFQEIANDTAFNEMLLRGEPALTVLKDPKAKAIIENPDLLKEIHGLVKNDLKDLYVFLDTGKSPKYDSEFILGRWVFDVQGAIAALKKADPEIGSGKLLSMRRFFSAAFANASFIATTDNQAILKAAGPLRAPTAGAPPVTEAQTLRGQWKKSGSRYEVSLPVGGIEQKLAAVVEDERLKIGGGAFPLVFRKEF